MRSSLTKINSSSSNPIFSLTKNPRIFYLNYITTSSHYLLNHFYNIILCLKQDFDVSRFLLNLDFICHDIWNIIKSKHGILRTYQSIPIVLNQIDECWVWLVTLAPESRLSYLIFVGIEHYELGW